MPYNAPTRDSLPVPLTVTLGPIPPTLSPAPVTFSREAVPPDEPGMTVQELPGSFAVSYSDGTRFVIRDDGGEVWGDWSAPFTVEDAATYLLGPIIAFVLRLRGVLCLHGGVVELGDDAIVIMGGAEAGKSTLTGAFALRGHKVLSDDVAPIVKDGDDLLVHPTYPRVRLWPDSVGHLLGASAALPALTPNWDKRYLDVAARGLFEHRPTSLCAIFALDDRVDSTEAPWVERITPRAAFASVLANLHTVWMLPAHPQGAVFRFASELARSVPVFRLVPHADPDRIWALCGLVEREHAALRPPISDGAGGS